MNVAQPVPVAESELAELRAATVAHRDAREVAERAAARMRKATLTAIDAGVPQKQVARILGVSRARVGAIVALEASRP